MKAAEGFFSPKLSRVFKSVWTLAIALAFLKLWLTSHLPIMASAAPHDNLRYVIMAANFLQPDVPYDRYALMRQPGYPAFIAFSYLLGFSLRFSQELLYLISGLFLAWSFHKYYRQKLVTVLFISLYIFAPASFHWNRQTLQESLYLPLIVFIFGCLIHLINLELTSPRFLKWSAILGVGMGLFWNARPEGMAIAPSLAIAYSIVLRKFTQNFAPDISFPFLTKSAIKSLLFSLLLVAIPIFIITSLFSFSIYLKYGLFRTSDIDSPGFKAAYSRLTSVSPHRWKYQVALPKATRLEIYAISPSFRKLSGYLEGEKSRGWTKTSCVEASICDDYASGWLFWALRDAVADAGQYKSARDTEAFYWQIAREVEAACQSGQLNCKDRRFSLSSFAPDLRPEYLAPFLKSLETLSGNLIPCSLTLNLGSGEEDYQLRKTYFEKIAREPADFIEQRQLSINRIKDKLTNLIGGVYKFLLPILTGMAAIGIGWEALRGRALSRSIPLTILWLILSFIIIRVLLFAYIDATSYPIGSGCRYLRPVLPLMWMGVAIGVSYLSQRLSKGQDVVS